MLSFTLLGQALLSKNGGPLDRFRSQKEAALLVYLAQTRESCTRETIATLLWDRSSTKQALSNLRTVLTRVRKQVGDALVVTRRSITFAPDCWPAVDSVELLESLMAIKSIDSAEKARAIQQALNAYQGEFLANFELPNAPQFDAWITTVRASIHRQVIAAYQNLGQFALATGDMALGLEVASQWLTVDELDESAHTLLIQCQVDSGNTAAALQHYDHAAQLLETELGIAPPTEIVELIKSIRPTPLAPPPQTLGTHHNLPAPFNQFFGRSSDQAEIHARLDQPYCRLITIVGPGGAGKSRLAMMVARCRQVAYPDGVWLVPLAELDPNDPDLPEAIAIEIAIHLDLRLTGKRKPIEQLLTHLAQKRMLLVLDNFEHIMGGIPLVQRLTAELPTVQIIVTSREILGLQTEWRFQLGGLAYPTNSDDEGQSDAVDLFCGRYAQWQRGHISAEERKAIRHICHVVEGLPLAIELAAALTSEAHCTTIAKWLDEDLEVLETSLRDVPKRHRSLYTVFEMSWRQLTTDLQQLLARLSVFRGGLTQHAAKHIAGARRQQLTALRDKSLLQQDRTGRYTLHVMVRDFSAEKRPVSDKTLHQHAAYYLTFLAQHREPLRQDAPQKSVAEIEPEIDNVRLAWLTAVEQKQPRLLYDAVDSLSSYYQLRGLSHEAEAAMQTAYKQAQNWGADSLTLAARTGLEQARFLIRLSRYLPAQYMLQAALKSAEAAGDQWAIGMGHILLGEVLWRTGEYDSAESKLNQALSIAQAIDSTLLVGWCHHHLGITNDIRSQYAQAHRHLQQAIVAWRAINNAQALSVTLNSIGFVSYHQGDYAAAQSAMEQALTLCEQLDNRRLQSLLLNNLSMLAIEQRDYRGAQFYLQLGLELASTTGDLSWQGLIYANLGKSYNLLGETEPAIEYLEKGLQIVESLGERYAIVQVMIMFAEAVQGHGKTARAETLYRQALSIARQDNLQLTECEALVGLANLLHQVNQTQAQCYIEEALHLAQSLQHPKMLGRVELLQQTLVEERVRSEGF